MVGRSSRARYGLAAAPVFLLALALYLHTLLPDVGTWDTAEFQTIGAVLGIAHPTGYPTYTLLAWLASVLLQPLGSEAYRADLLSALLVAGAAALVSVVTVQLTRRWPLGLVAGIAFAVSPVAWRIGTRADAHALHVFLAALLLVLLIEWARRERIPGPTGADRETRPAGRWLVAAAVVFGLSLGNHALTLLLAPGIVAFVLLVEPRILWLRTRLVLASLAAMALTTVLVYAYLPLRSAMEPPLDYASPRTWGSFWYVVLGEQFRGSIRPLPVLPDLVAGIWDELVRNLGLLVVLVPAGAVLGATRHGRFVVLTGLWFVCTWLFALGYANAAIERYYLVPLLVACIWVALAADVAWDAFRDLVRRPAQPGRASRSSRARSRTALVGGVLIVALIATALAPVPGRFKGLDASDNDYGRDWLEATLTALEPNAAVVSWWSFSTPLWYGRWVEGRRPDIVIVDDRDVLDDGFGTAQNAIDHYLADRPVYIVRRDKDLPAFEERYVLERVEAVPAPGKLYRVDGRRSEDSGAAE